MGRSVLTTQIGSLLEALYPDGAAAKIEWVTPPRGRRRAARRELERSGLVVDGSWIAQPASGPRQLVPLEPWALHRALAESRLRGVRIPRWAIGVVEEAAPSVGVVARKPGEPPALDWLQEVVPGRDALPIVRLSWSGAGVHLVLRDRRVVKTASPAEAAALSELGPAAREAGAAVPRVLFSGPAGGRFVLALDALPGVLAAALLRRRPDRLGDVVQLVGGWLERWHRLTRVVRPLSEHDVEQHVLGPVRRLGSLLPEAYVRWIVQRAESLVGANAPLAAAHNDLTTWNVLVDDARVGVVDWEAARTDALPLVDVEYFAVDAVATAQGLSRDRAFDICATGELVPELRARIAASLEVPPPIAELARHAAWLDHAANESERPAAARDQAFAAIVARLAATVA